MIINHQYSFNYGMTMQATHRERTINKTRKYTNIVLVNAM